jgi:hypothetical protein
VANVLTRNHEVMPGDKSTFPKTDFFDGIERNRLRKRKRDDTDQDEFTSLSGMKRILSVERNSILSDIDDLILALNLLELEPRKTCGCKTSEARQGNCARTND